MHSLDAMPRWEAVAIGYFSYLAVTAVAVPRFAKARWPAVATAMAAWAVLPVLATIALPDIVRTLAPGVVLLAGYWLSGAFFVRAMPRVEAGLRRWDARLLDRTGARRWYRRTPRFVHEAFELAYLLAYPMVPIGALVLLAGGHADDLGRFWSTVLLAAFGAYGALPWVQTRAPRMLDEEAAALPDRSFVRRLNLSVLDRASVQVNTVPSGHAAAALAVALAVAVVMPVAGAVLLVLAMSIAAAATLGGYHYALDTILGGLLAVGAWALVAALGTAKLMAS